MLCIALSQFNKNTAIHTALMPLSPMWCPSPIEKSRVGVTRRERTGDKGKQKYKNLGKRIREISSLAGRNPTMTARERETRERREREREEASCSNLKISKS